MSQGESQRRPAHAVERWGNLLLSLTSSAAFIVVMIAAEWAARGWEPGYLVRTRGLHVFSRTYGWSGRPRAVAPMGSGQVSLDGSGFRGPALDRKDAGGQARVVVLGDSVAFGFGVADDETFPHLLEARENGLEVGNLAVQGYGPGQELLVLKHDGLRLEPDVVVLALCLRNDFVDAMLPVALYNGVTPRPRFTLGAGGLALDDRAMRRSHSEGAVQWLSDHSHLFNRVWSVAAPPQEEPEEIWRDRKREALRDEGAALRLVVALVLEMQRVTSDRGIAFVVATFPSGLGYGAEPDLHRRLHEELQAAGARVIDFRARFEALGLSPAEIAIDSTGHLTPRGHTVVAEHLETEILSLRARDEPRP